MNPKPGTGAARSEGAPLIPMSFHRRRAERALRQTGPSLPAMLERVAALAERVNESGAALPVDEVREIAAHAEEVWGGLVESNAEPAPSRVALQLTALIADLESVLLPDPLFARIVGALVSSILTGTPIDAVAFDGMRAMLEPARDDARRATDIAGGSLRTLVRGAYRFRATAARRPPKGPAVRSLRRALEVLAQVAQEKGLGLSRLSPSADTEPPDFLERRRIEGATASWKQRCGLSTLGGGLSRPEAEILLSRIASELCDPDPTVAHNALLAATVFSTQLELYELADIPIGRREGDSAWVTSNLRQFRIDLTGLRRRPERPVDLSLFLPTTPLIGISCAKELADGLARRRELCPDAQTMGELLGFDEKSARNLLAYLRERAPSSRPITIRRLARSLSRLLLDLCHDEAVAASFTADFTLLAPSVFHYAFLSAAGRNFVLSEGYRAVGFSGELAEPLESDFSLNPHPTDRAVARFVEQNFRAFIEAIGRLPPRSRPSSLLQRFNRATRHLVALLVALASLRPQECETLSLNALSIDGGWALRYDKVSSEYWMFRVVALPDPLPAILRLYCQRLAELAARCAPTLPALAADILDRLRSDSGAALLMRFVDGQAKPIRSCDYADCFIVDGVPLASNFGRRLVERVAREAGLTSVEVGAQTGHGAEGQEPFSRTSGLRVRSVIDSMREAWRRKAPALGLAEAARQIPGSTWRPRPALTLTEPDRPASAEEFTEPCPFPRDLAHASRIDHQLSRAVRTRPAADPRVLLIECLVYRDGICNLLELRAVLESIATDGIFAHADPFLAFVDCTVKGAGRRRVRLSAATVLAASRLGADPLDATEAVRQFGAAVVRRLGVHGSNPARAVRVALAGAAAWQTLNWPGLARSHSALLYNSRTAHPQVLAREVGLDLVTLPRGRISRSVLSSDDPVTPLVGELDQVRDAFRKIIAEEKHPAAWRDPWALAFHMDLALAAMDELSRAYFAVLHRLFALEPVRDTTLLPYISVVHPFMVWLARDAETPLEERDLRAERREWERTCLDPQAKDSSNRNAMFGHLQQLLGQDPVGRRRRPPADNYVHAVRRDDVTSAIALLRSADNAALEILNLAEGVLAVSALTPLRPSEAVHPRFIDFVLGRWPGLVVTRAAGGHTKSASGERLALVPAAEFVRDVMPFLRRRAAGISDASAHIFADPAEPQAVERLQRATRTARAALQLACGSPQVRRYDLRGMVISERLVVRQLDPADAGLASSHEQRNVGALGAAENGHAHPIVGPCLYFHRADEVRRSLMDRALADPDNAMTVPLAAALSGKSDEAMRKWHERHDTTAAALDEHLRQLAGRLVGSGRIKPFDQIPDLVPDTMAVRSTPEAPRQLPPPRELAAVVLKRLDGVTPHVAAAGTSLAAWHLDGIDEAIAFWTLRLGAGAAPQVRRLLERPEWLEAALSCSEAALQHAFTDLEAHTLAGLIALADRPWGLANLEDLERLDVVKRLCDRVVPRLHVPPRQVTEAVRKAVRLRGIELARKPAALPPQAAALLDFKPLVPRRAPACLVASSATFIALVGHYLRRNAR